MHIRVSMINVTREKIPPPFPFLIGNFANMTHVYTHTHTH